MKRGAVLLAGLSCLLALGLVATGESTSETTSEAGDWVLPVPDLDYNAREGRAVFLYYCAPCHGAEGHGDGFNAYNLDPKPRDLGSSEFQADRADEDLIAVVRTGGGAAGLSTGMPPWGGILSDRQIRNVIRFVRTLEPQEE